MANTKLEITQCPAAPLILFFETMALAKKEHLILLGDCITDIRKPFYVLAFKIAVANNIIFKVKEVDNGEH